jgi:hypothetical protein
LRLTEEPREGSVSQAHEYPVRSGCDVCGDLGVGARRLGGAKPEQPLEGGHRGAAAVVAEDELVEVDLQVLLRRAAVSPLQPGLEVGEGAVGAGKIILRSSLRQRWETGR